MVLAGSSHMSSTLLSLMTGIFSMIKQKHLNLLSTTYCLFNKRKKARNHQALQRSLFLSQAHIANR